MDDGGDIDRPVCIVVAGMHRSGTSAITGVLSLLGCDIPGQLVEADQFNERGYWESRHLADLNNEILAASGTTWNEWSQIDPDWLTGTARSEFGDRAVAFLRQNFAQSRLFVLKDPRFSRLLPFWLEQIRTFGARPTIVSPIRHPVEVANSLLQRNGMNPAVSELVWLQHVLDAEWHSRTLRRCFVRYEDLLADWRSCVTRIAVTLQTAWPKALSGAEDEIDGFLSSALRHNVVGVDGDPGGDVTSPWVWRTWQILERWASGTGSESDQRELDDIRLAFNTANRTFTRPIKEHDAHGRFLQAKLVNTEEHTAQAEMELKEARASLHQAEARAADTESRLGEALTRSNWALERTKTLEADVAYLENDLHLIRSSTSWRITAPVRSIMTALRSVTGSLQSTTLSAARKLVGGYRRFVPASVRARVPMRLRNGVRQVLSRVRPVAAGTRPALGETTLVHGRPSLRPVAVFVTHDANIGGAPNVLASIGTWFARHTDYEVKIICMDGGPLVEQFQSIAPTFVAGFTEVPESRREPLRHAVEDFVGRSPAFIFVNSAAASGFVAINPFDAPLFAYIHELGNIIDRIGRPFDDLMRNVRHVFCDGTAVRDLLLSRFGLESDQLTVQHSFIEAPVDLARIPATQKAALRRELNLPEHQKLIVGCGVVHWRKQPDVFVRLGKYLSGSGRSASLVWIGDGEDLAKMRALVRREGLAQSIQFIGYSADFRRYFGAADVFALTSSEDPFPLVCLEAAVACAPSVVFREAGSMASFVAPESEPAAGMVVPITNEESYFRAVAELLDDEDVRARLAEAGHTRALASYTTDVCVPEILRTIQRAAGLRPRVSVIVPNYNCEPYLEQRLESIRAQTFKDTEFLLLDDNSTDGSLARLTTFAENNADARLFLSEQNGGSPFLAWRKGIERAKGELVWIAEADDYCESNFLAEMVAVFRTSGVRLAHGRSIPVNETGEVAGDWRELYLDAIAPGRWETSHCEPCGREIDLGLGWANTIPNASAVVVQRSAALSAIGAAASFRLAGDWAFYVAAIHGGRIVYCHEAINYHRRHTETVTKAIEGSAQYFQELADVHALVDQLYGSSAERTGRFRARLGSEAKRFGVPSAEPTGTVPAGRDVARAPGILYGVGDLSGGGAQMFALRFVNRWVRYPAPAVLFVTGHEPDHPALLSQLDPMVAVVDVTEIQQVGLTQFLHDWALDRVITGHWWADFAAGQLVEASGAEVPWAIVMHGCYESVLSTPQAYVAIEDHFRRAQELCSLWVWTAPKNKTVFERGHISPRDGVHIVNGFAPTEPRSVSRGELGLPEDRTIFTLASRAIEAKGWKAALQACQILSHDTRTQGRFHLQLIGDGPIADELGVKAPLEGVSVVPYTSRLADHIQASDVCLLPSWFSGKSLPLVLIEFLAQKKPAIVSDIGLCSWAIEAPDGTLAGKVVPRRGANGEVAATDLAAAMLPFITDPSLAQSLAPVASAAFTKFDFEEMIENYRAVLTQLVASKT